MCQDIVDRVIRSRLGLVIPGRIESEASERRAIEGHDLDAAVVEVPALAAHLVGSRYSECVEGVVDEVIQRHLHTPSRNNTDIAFVSGNCRLCFVTAGAVKPVSGDVRWVGELGKTSRRHHHALSAADDPSGKTVEEFGSGFSS